MACLIKEGAVVDDESDSELERSIKHLDDKPIRFVGSRGKIGLSLLGCLSLCLGGLSEMFQPGTYRGMRVSFIGYLAVMFFGACSVVIAMLIVRPPVLTSTSKRFHFRYGLNQSNRLWEEIEAFRIYHSSASDEDIASYTRARTSEQVTSERRQARGHDGSFPDVFELEPYELVELQETARRRWSPARTPVLVQSP